MATTFKGVIKRQARIYGVPAPVIITITESGLEMAVAGFKTKLFASWDHVAKGMITPSNVPSPLAQRPIEFLKSQAVKHKQKEVLTL